MKSLKLSNGVEIPEIGHGTWLAKGDDAYNGTLIALSLGYRHIDSASAYGNEVEVGKAIRDSNINRSEIFLTSKVPAEIKNYEEAKKIIQKSLDNFNAGYIDLMLIHCPQPWDEYGKKSYRYEKENLDVWKALLEYYNQGLIKAVGVSNFSIEDIKNIQNNSSVAPQVNQIEIHIGDTPIELINYCQDNNIVVEAYCPNGHGKLIKDPLIEKLANKYKVTPAQICIKYTLMLNTVSLPKSLSKEHLQDNLKMDFELSIEDMEMLKNIKM